MFEIAATRFGDADGEYHLARMFIDGAGGLEKDKLRAAKWLGLAAEKGHRGAQALLGHMLFRGDGVPRQAARGLMWLTIASVSAKAPKDAWIRDLQAKDLVAASDNERSAAAAFLAARGKREIAAALSAPAHAAATASAPPLQLTGAPPPRSNRRRSPRAHSAKFERDAFRRREIWRMLRRRRRDLRPTRLTPEEGEGG